MRVVLNEFTRTIHKPSDEASTNHTRCGALRHVSSDRVRTTSSEDVRTEDTVRCGRCFLDAGGY